MVTWGFRGDSKGPHSHSCDDMGIQYHEGDGFDSQFVQELFLMEIYLTSLGLKYLNAATCKMIIDRGSL